MSKKELFILGLKHAIPIWFGYIPVGIAYAVYALNTGLSDFETILLSLTCYSGSGQFLTISMLSSQASFAAILIGIFLINFRYFIMSACVFNRFDNLPLWPRFLMCHLVTDETFAIFTTQEKGRIGIPYWAGLFLSSWLSWVSGAILGVMASSFLPDSVTLALGIGLFALFIAIIMPGCKSNRKIMLLVVCTALLNCALSYVIDMNWAIVVSTVVCAGAGATFIRSDEYTESDEKEDAE